MLITLVLLTVALAVSAGVLLLRAKNARSRLLALQDEYASESDAWKKNQHNFDAQTQALSAELANSRESLAAANATVQQLREQLAQVTQQLEKAENTNKQQQQQALQENTILQQFKPLAAGLEQLSVKVQNIEEQRAKQHGELVGRLNNSDLATQTLTQTAQSLAAALNSSNSQGSWGESSLRKLVEAAGMLQHVEFAEQVALTDSDGQVKRPDMVISLPNKRAIALDAKAPISSFLALDAQASAADIKNAQKQHAAHLKKHIQAVVGRKYQDALDNTLDLVVVFVPSDALLAHAFNGDPGLYDFCYQNGVVLASPSTLFAILKGVAHSWQQQSLQKQAQQIYNLSRELYERMAQLGKHLTAVGKGIESAMNNYNRVVGSLQNRVIPTGRKLNQIQPSLFDPEKQDFPEQELNLQARTFTAPEITAAAEYAETESAPDVKSAGD